MYKFVQWFLRITGYIPSLFYFRRRKVYYENRKSQGRRIKGKAIVVSNHFYVYDFALYLFVFYQSNLRPLIGEALFHYNKAFNFLARAIGGIKVERDAYDFTFMSKAVNALNKKQKLLIFPEARFPLEHEMDLLPFTPSFVYIALESGAPIVPVYHNKKFKKKGYTSCIIGEKIYLTELYDHSLSEKENVERLTNYVRNYIISLGKKLDEKDKR
ncbi:MAG TPA: lysophospholipid acyltransferase family protein [Bacilli bacterium]|nr:lysophospholipid acyltransferase family protein [Bacilli bacterium]HPK86274.1 lysophospholipid acyltransferase family protein [Bacilli bacterium]